jgi:hypothetical protein
MNKVYKFFKNLFFKPAKNNQEFIDKCKPMEEVLKNIEDDKNKTTYKSIAEKDYYMRISNIRFESLQSGHNLGKLTSDEERELENMLTINMLDLRPWTRERIGMRACYFL